MSDYVGADYVGADADLDELLGVGDDYEDEVGASRRRNPRAKLMKLQKLSRAKLLPAVLLGFDQTVTASSTATATAEPNVSLRPTDLIVRESNADDFQITSIRIGRVDLITGAVGVPAGIFVSSVQRPPVSAPELQAGTNAQIALTNLTAASTRFLAAMTCLDLSRHPVSP